MIIIDLSHIAVASAFASAKPIVTSKLEPDYDKEGLLRHYILNGIRKQVLQFKREYGDVYIACDSGKNARLWRKDVFPYYKAARKAMRENSLVDFQMLYKVVDDIIEQLPKYVPYKFIRMDGVEADDIVAALTIITHKKNPDEKIIIISSDKDFKQLHFSPNIKQISAVTDEYVECVNHEAELLELVVHGDTSDGVPNILSDDDVFVTQNKKQKRLMPKIKEQMRTFDGLKEYLERNNLQHNYTRNYALIALNEETIPAKVFETASQVIDTPKMKVDWFKFREWLSSVGMKKLSEQFGDFI